MKFSAFELKVYNIVSNISIGEVRTYQWVAKKAGHPKASRAVGQALKRNPYPLLIPCHRVIRSDGSLGGYSLGKRLKRRLLDLERRLAKEFKSGIINEATTYEARSAR